MVSYKVEAFIWFVIISEMVWLIIVSTGLLTSFFTGFYFNETSLQLDAINNGANNTFSPISTPGEINTSINQVNSSIISASALTDPLALVKMFGIYINLFLTISVNFANKYTFVGYFLYFLLGETWVNMLKTIFGILVVMLIIRVASGRIRWS